MGIKTTHIEVLSKANKPLHTKQITEQIISAGPWKSNGKTPEATLSARIYPDIKKNSDNSLFIKVAPQTFTYLFCDNYDCRLTTIRTAVFYSYC